MPCCHSPALNQPLLFLLSVYLMAHAPAGLLMESVMRMKTSVDASWAYHLHLMRSRAKRLMARVGCKEMGERRRRRAEAEGKNGLESFDHRAWLPSTTAAGIMRVRCRLTIGRRKELALGKGAVIVSRPWSRL